MLRHLEHSIAKEICTFAAIFTQRHLSVTMLHDSWVD